MAGMTVRIHEETHRTLSELSKKTGKPMPVILEKAVEEYQRKNFLERLAADFAELRKNEKKWQEELEERAIWEVTLLDH
jgi:predicted transcriptional regulator